MNRITSVGRIGLGLVCLSATALSGCGDDADPAGTNEFSTAGLGNVSVRCEGQSGQQQQQVSYKKQQQQGCGAQQIQYKEKIEDLDVKLDCDARQVTVTAKGVKDGDDSSPQQQALLPIDDNGSIKGEIKVPQQLQNDGKGNQVCWVEYRVDLSGKAECDKPVEGGTNGGNEPQRTQDNLRLRAEVNVEATTNEALQQAGIVGGPGPSPSPSPSPSASPSPSPSMSPSPTPSPAPSPSPSVTPQPSPSPSGTPVVVCIIEDPCPVVAETSVSCPAE